MSMDISASKQVAEILMESAAKGHGNLIITVVEGIPRISYSVGEFEKQLQAAVDEIAPGEGYYVTDEESSRLVDGRVGGYQVIMSAREKAKLDLNLLYGAHGGGSTADPHTDGGSTWNTTTGHTTDTESGPTDTNPDTTTCTTPPDLVQ